MLNPKMKYSASGVTLTKSFEGKRNVAYWDKTGKVWTIGYGHTGPDVHEGLEWTDEQCEAGFLRDIAPAENNVNEHVCGIITQGMFDALVDFDYNCGKNNLNSSTLLRMVNAGDKEHAAKEFEKWDHSGGIEIAGLLRRRIAEEAAFNS